jgi:hypothetical protein
VAHAVVTFPGEGHGFRRAESLRTALEGERWFYGRVLGFETGAPPAGVALASGAAAERRAGAGARRVGAGARAGADGAAREARGRRGGERGE